MSHIESNQIQKALLAWTKTYFLFLTQVLSMRAFIALHVEQGVAIIYERGSLRTNWNVHCLAVTGYQEPVVHG